MKLKALSHYDGDLNTRFGDCILLYGTKSLVVYDCGHARHAETVKDFLQKNESILQVHIVVSHNDSDHTTGVCDLLGWLCEQGKYSVSIYSHQYLKHVDTILDKIDDGRRNRDSLKRALLAEFDNIKAIIEKAQKCGFPAVEALSGTNVGDNCTIVGPTIDEFTDVAAKAVDSREDNNIGEGHAEETVMNAASVQLKCRLISGEIILLCGDASPAYMHNLDSYNIIQLPHHGQLDDAKAVFEKLKDPYSKEYLISDNTGSSANSGGSDKLVQYMRDEKYSPALNTKNEVVDIPQDGVGVVTISKSQGVRLGEVDY